MHKIKINQLLYTCALLILAFLVSSILLLSINLNNAEFFSTFLYGYKVPVFLIISAGALFLLLYTIIYFVKKYELDTKKYFPYVLFFAIFLLQSFFILWMKASLRYDTLKVFDEALSLLNGNVLSPDYSSGYFAKYPNNIPICIATALLLKPAVLLGISINNLMLYIQLINVLFMDISFYFSYKLLVLVRSRLDGVIFLFLVLLNPLTYLIAPFYYTHTFSMAFSTGAIYFFICCLAKDTTMKQRLIHAFLIGLLVSIGFKIRATVFIIPVAMLIYLLLNIKILSKKSIYTFAAFLTAILVGFGSYYLTQHHYVKFDYNETGYPATHWIMLGLQGSGGYNAADDAYTESFPTKAAREQATEAMILQRATQLKFKGLLHLWRDKLEITWSDGTDDFIDNISMTKDFSIRNDFISGSTNDLLVTYCHIFHFMLLFFLFISTVVALFYKPNYYLLVVFLNLLGGIIFHLIWEAGEVYNISFSCSVLVLAATGLSHSFKFMEEKRHTKLRPVFISTNIALVIFCFLYIGSKLTTIPYTHYNYAAKQDLAEPDTPKPLLSGTLDQTFTTTRPFNTIGIKVRNSLGAENCSSYKFQLLNANDEILYKSDILGAWAFDKDYYRIEFDTVLPVGKEEYKIKIIPDIVSDVHNLTFQYYNTGNYDIYQNGVLYQNDIKTNGDLTFMVFNKVDTSYLGK